MVVADYVCVRARARLQRVSEYECSAVCFARGLDLHDVQWVGAVVMAERAVPPYRMRVQ